MSINSKQKGKRGELELCDFLKENGYHAERSVQYKGRSDSADVIASKPLDTWHIEVKRTEKVNPYKALAQAADDCGAEKTPVVFHRRSREDWIVILTAEDFLACLKR